MSDLEAQLTALHQDGVAAIAAITSLDELEQLRIQYLGKKGSLSQILGGMGKLDAAERPRIGAAANEVKEALQTADRSEKDWSCRPPKLRHSLKQRRSM